MDTCRRFDENGQFLDVNVECDTSSMNLTVRLNGDGGCKGPIYFQTPYTWGECYPFYYDSNYFMILEAASFVKVAATVTSLTALSSLL